MEDGPIVLYDNRVDWKDIAFIVLFFGSHVRHASGSDGSPTQDFSDEGFAVRELVDVA